MAIALSRPGISSILSKTRALATLTNHTPDHFQVFDRHAKQLQRDRAALREGGASSRTVDYVRNEIAERMMERLEVRYTRNGFCSFDLVYISRLLHVCQDIKRKFDTVLDLGSGPGHFAKLLELEKTKKCIMIDSSGM